MGTIRGIAGALLVGVLSAGSSSALAQGLGPQPHMEAALAALQQAERELSEATPNKGGHREHALELVQKATNQVRKGIEYAATHR
jgi:hypothetical protein